MRVAGVAVALLALSACAPAPPYYSVPPQHKAVGEEEVVGFGEFVLSTNPAAESHYIKDVKGLEGSAWRWTHAEPEFRFFLKSVDKRAFRMDIGVNDTTFRDTGPLKTQIFVNGKLLDSPVFGKPGDVRYEHAVPSKMLNVNAENRVLVRVLNPWQAADPGVHLGFLLHGAGFVTE